MKILVVEDDHNVLVLLERLLGARGHTVISARDPDDAAFALSDQGGIPDILLTDIILDGLSGVDYARTMRAAHPGLRVIFMTGWPHREPSALRTGLGPVLRKPFTAEQLYEAVESA